MKSRSLDLNNALKSVRSNSRPWSARDLTESQKLSALKGRDETARLWLKDGGEVLRAYSLSYSHIKGERQWAASYCHTLLCRAGVLLRSGRCRAPNSGLDKRNVFPLGAFIGNRRGSGVRGLKYNVWTDGLGLVLNI